MPEETETITFEFIRKIQREEQRIQKLTKIPENFYKTASNYLTQKKQLTLKEERRDGFELKQIERLIHDIFDRRERKVMHFAVNASRVDEKSYPENILEEEKVFFDSVKGIIEKRRGENLQQILSGEHAEKETLIVFREDTPEFVASDMKTYGPFKKGDIAKLPEDNMKLLVERGVAEEFKISK